MKEDSINKCFKIAWVLYLLYLIEQPILSNRSIDIVVMIMITLILFWAVIRNFNVFGFYDIMIFAIIGLLIILSLLHTCENITIALLKSVFCFFVTYMLMFVASRSIINKSTFDFIFICTIFASILFVIYFFTPIAFVARNRNGERYISKSFTCNFNNPNFTGMILFGLFGNLLINIKIRKHKPLILLLMASLLFLICQTRSRACIVSTVMLIVFCLYFALKNNGEARKVNKLIICITLIIPILFIGIYLGLYYNGFQNVEILNKSLFSGRERTYVEYIDNIQDTLEFFIGNIAKTQFQNAHNGPLSIFTSIGVIGLILVYLMYAKNINCINKGTWMSSICVMCILGVFIHASVEAAFLVGGTASIMEMGSLFFLSSYTSVNGQIDNKVCGLANK